MSARADRRATIAALAAGTVDVLVVGGGIVGCGIARDAALRGLRVALVEQHDFGWGTTSRPTRLIHGGLRYLENFDFGLVRADLREREILLRTARHLVFPLRFLMPEYDSGVLERAKLRAGMVLYDLLSFDKSLPGRRWLSPAEVIAEEPALRPEGLQGAWSFYDAQVPLVERLVVENLIDAAGAGAHVLNRARVERFLQDATGRVTGAAVRDLLADRGLEIRARVTVNATGAWLDVTNRGVLPGRPRALRMTKGVHLVTPSGTRNALVLFAQTDGRLFFVTPWLGCSLVGTTDTDYTGDPADAEPDAEDVRYLQEEARRALPAAPFGTVHYAYAGVRALVRMDGVAEGEVSRKHAVVDHEHRDRLPGLVSVLGGKITAYRSVAEEVAVLVSRRLGRVTVGSTERRPLPGGAFGDLGELVERELWPRAAALGLDRAQAEHLAQVHGALAHRVLDRVEGDHAQADRLQPGHPTILAQLVHAFEDEWAASLADGLLRRTTLGLGPDQASGCVGVIAQRMGRLLGWDAAERAEQVAAYLAEVAPMRRFSARPVAEAVAPVL
jgi:glycerol-3-phosphate dehydrogenase